MISETQLPDDKETAPLSKGQRKKLRHKEIRDQEETVEALMQYIRSVINRDLVTIFKFFYGQATQIWVHRVKVDDKRTEQLVQEEYGTKSVLHQDNPVVREVIDTWIQETGVHVVLDAESDAIYAVIRCSPNRPCQEAGVTSLDFDEMKTVMDCVMKHSGGTGSVRPLTYHAVPTIPPAGVARKGWYNKHKLIWEERMISVTGRMEGVGTAGKMIPGVIAEPYSLTPGAKSGENVTEAHKMIADKNVPRIINSRIGKLDKEMLEEAQLLAFDYNLPGFNLYTYGDSGAYDLTVPALWIVSNCFSNVVHVDSADKTKTTYTAWWQARHHDETGQWTLADNETDQNKVQNGAFLIPSLGLGINLQKMCGQGFVEATFQAKSHYHVTTASEQAPGYTRHGLGVAVTSRQVNTAVLAAKARSEGGAGIYTFQDIKDTWTRTIGGQKGDKKVTRPKKTPKRIAKTASDKPGPSTAPPQAIYLPPPKPTRPPSAPNRYQPPRPDSRAARLSAQENEFRRIIQVLEESKKAKIQMDGFLDGHKAVWKRLRKKHEEELTAMTGEDNWENSVTKDASDGETDDTEKEEEVDNQIDLTHGSEELWEKIGADNDLQSWTTKMV